MRDFEMSWRAHPERATLAGFLDLWLDGPEHRRHVFSRLLELPSGARVLDLGGKHGEASVALAARLAGDGALVIVEPALRSPRALRHRLDATGTPWAWRADPLEGLALPDASQDVVWSYNLLARDDAAALRVLREAHRVLRPGGRVYLREPEHLHFVLLPPGRLIEIGGGDARLAAALAEADRGEVAVGAGSRMMHQIEAAGFEALSLYPLSMTRRGPLDDVSARRLAVALPFLGLGEPDEPMIDPFNRDSPFYLLGQPDFALTESDLLLSARRPRALT